MQQIHKYLPWYVLEQKLKNIREYSIAKSQILHLIVYNTLQTKK